MNINELKELVKHCVYIEKGIVCMNDTYYNDMIHTMENLQSKIDKIIEKCQNTTYYQWDTYRDENFNLKGEKYETNLINKSEILDILKEKI